MWWTWAWALATGLVAAAAWIILAEWVTLAEREAWLLIYRNP